MELHNILLSSLENYVSFIAGFPCPNVHALLNCSSRLLSSFVSLEVEKLMLGRMKSRAPGFQ